jgi:hypothetical protein
MSKETPIKKGNAPQVLPYQKTNNMDYKDTDFPAGNITLEDLNADFERHTSDKPRKATKKRKTAFPLDVLPPSLKLFIEEAEKVYGIHPDFMGPAILYAAAVAMGKTHLLQIKRGYNEAAVLWLVLVGDPGTNKSGALKQALAPIFEWQRETFQQYKLDKAEYEALAGMSKKERREAGEDEELPPPPRWQQRITNDTTPEAFADILQYNPSGVGIYRDELAGWFKSFDRYSKGAEQEQMLTSWSLGAMIINRTSKEPISIHRPFAPVAGTIQPGVIEGITKDNRSENGFTDRLLFAWPEDQEKPLRTTAEMPESLAQAYAEGIAKLLNIGFEDPEASTPYLLRFTTEAGERFLSYSNEYIKELCDKSEDRRRKSLFTKFDIHAPRLALILQMLWHVFEGKRKDAVELETMERAIKTGDYFLKQSERVFELVNEATPLDKLPDDKKELYNALPQRFKTGDGETIADKHGLKSAFKRKSFLYNKLLFKNIGAGQYEKIY